MNGNSTEKQKHGLDPIGERDAVTRYGRATELFSQESVCEYMNAMEAGGGTNDNVANDEDDAVNFDDYLQAQRRLKLRRLSRRNLNQSKEGDKGNESFHFKDDSRAQSQRLRAISMVGRRQIFVSDSAELQVVIHKPVVELDQEGDEVEHDNHHAHTIPFYSHPLQRQQWGDDQVLPHINWGDLFFDLFYVAAAYNLGNMLVSALEANDWPRGVVYFIGIFGPLYNMWENELVYSARYTVVDFAHRLFEVVRYFIVANATLHVKPLNLLSDSGSVETFFLTLSMCLESVLQLALNLELVWYAEGDRKAIINHTKREINNKYIPMTLIYMVAAIVSGVLYYRSVPKEAGSDETNWSVSDLPLSLCFLAYILNIGYTTFRKMRFENEKKGDIRDHFVPNNIDYMIHRYGEWIMLVIGESVLSLLIVETEESKEYYIITSLGVLTVIILQALKFESQPSHADGHALWRNLSAGMMFSVSIQTLSMGLIAFGVCYKEMLYTLVKDGGYSRMLASKDPSMTEKATAALFCGSLTVVLLSLELMLSSHTGGRKNLYLLGNNLEAQYRTLNWPLVVIALAKLGLILFTATLSQWQTDPTSLTAIGFVVVTAMATVGIVEWGIVHRGKEIEQVAQKIAQSFKSVQKGIETKVSSSADAASARSGRSGKLGTEKGDNDSSATIGTAEIEFDNTSWDTSCDVISGTDIAMI